MSLGGALSHPKTFAESVHANCDFTGILTSLVTALMILDTSLAPHSSRQRIVVEEVGATFVLAQMRLTSMVESV